MDTPEAVTTSSARRVSSSKSEPAEVSTSSFKSASASSKGSFDFCPRRLRMSGPMSPKAQSAECPTFFVCTLPARMWCAFRHLMPVLEVVAI